MPKNKPRLGRIAIVPSNEYLFLEFYLPLLERAPSPKMFVIIWDKSSLIKLDRTKKEYIKSLPSVNRIIEVELLYGGIVKSAFVSNRLLKQLDDVNLIVAMDISTHLMRLVSHVFEAFGGTIAFTQVSGLHHQIWKPTYENFVTNDKSSSSSSASGQRSQRLKILNINKYPKYFRFLVAAMTYKLNNLLLSHVIAPLAIGAKLKQMPKSNCQYFNSFSNKAIMIYRPDAEILANTISRENIIIAKPPYMDSGDDEKEHALLVGFPGPLTEKQAKENMIPFFAILERVKTFRQPVKMMFRCHPRETIEIKQIFVRALSEHFDKTEIHDVSGLPLHEILGECHTVLAGVSNLLAVARATSKSRLVIGVKHAGLEGILGTNIQYQDIGDVLWVSTVEDLDEVYLNANNYAQQSENAMPYYDALMTLSRASGRL